MDRSPRLWGPGYLVALFLVAAPFTDLVLRTRPWAPTSVEWRYGAAGFVSLSLSAPFIGLLLAMVVSAVLRHEAALRVLAVLALVGSPVLLALGGGFALDAQQMRSMVNPAVARSFEISALVALAKYGLGAILLAGTGWAGLRTAASR